MKKQTLIHRLQAKQLAKEGNFLIQESVIIGLGDSIVAWFHLIIESKRQKKQKERIAYYDLWGYADELSEILKELKGGIKKK